MRMKLNLLLILVVAFGIFSAPAAGRASNLTPRAFLPIVAKSPPACPVSSTNTYAVVPIDDSYYKENRLTDENPDFRLSILGYAPINQPLGVVVYGGSMDPNAPRFRQIFRPARLPTFVAAYNNYTWHWDENAPPPYGMRGPLNNDPHFPVTVLDLATTPGEPIHIPARSVPIYGGNVVAMVLYADEDELAITYTRFDHVWHWGGMYAAYLLNFCVDPNLVATYRAQLNAGRRSTGHLPAIRNDQPVGVARGGSLTVAIRDTARFMDPRASDWWQP
jgi:hypothetical protein